MPSTIAQRSHALNDRFQAVVRFPVLYSNQRRPTPSGLIATTENTMEELRERLANLVGHVAGIMVRL